MRKVKPDIIYCAITGYGQTGSKRDQAGHDLNYIGDAGLLALGMGDRQRPVVPPALIADIAGGAYPAVLNILLALRNRDRTGDGAYLDISMTDNLFPFMYWAIGAGLAAGQWPGNGDGLVTGGSPRYQLYPTSDGQMLAAAPLEKKFWKAFCDAIGLDEALRDDAYDRQATRNRVADIIASKPADHWRSIFRKADCCCTIVQSIEQAMEDPHFRSRGIFDARLKNEDGSEITALPAPIAPAFREGSADVAAAPGLAEHNDFF
jgi:crotonobetainyl-CoA:carnitine CoA-transferase CaiB-like acyl-CoA transferase